MLSQVISPGKKVPTIVSTLVLLWGVFFSGLVYMLYKTEMKAEQLSSVTDSKYTSLLKDY